MTPMSQTNSIAFVGGGLDRAAHLRKEADRLLQDGAARVVCLWHGRPLVAGSPDSADTRLLRLETDHPALAQRGPDMIFLGLQGDTPVFAADLSAWSPEEVPGDLGPGRSGADQPATALPGLPNSARFADLRGLLADLPAEDATLVATGKSMLDWHRSHRFCAACGTQSQIAQAGWQRDCPACGRAHFPRTDPVVIMLITHGNALLLGRSPGWPEGMYSLLAGFMEPGETIEDAVRRETAEEAGVPVGPVRVLANQPWPWPSSLMIGCQGDALATDITLDPAELEQALWVSREELLEVFAGRHPLIRPARKGAIAYHLMQLWLADRLD